MVDLKKSVVIGFLHSDFMENIFSNNTETCIFEAK